MKYINYYNNLYGCHYICSYNDSSITYRCIDNNICEAVSDKSGLYKTMDECIKNCSCKATYNCIDGTCVKATGCKGTYSSLDDCKDRCCNKGCGWVSIYDTHLTKAYSKGNYCDNNCGYGFTQYYEDSSPSDSGKGPWNISCINDCLNISKADALEQKYYTFIQYFSQKAFPSEKSCDSHCKGTVSDSPIGSDKKWYIEFSDKGNTDFEIHNIEQPIFTDKNCFYQLRICKGCDDCIVYDLPSVPINNGLVYKGSADMPYKIYIEYKGT